MSSLQQRILAALVLIPLVVAAVLWLPSMGFAIVLAGFALLGAHEWGRIGELSAGMQFSFVAIAGLSMLAGYFWLQHQLLLPVVLALSMSWWGVALFAVIRTQRQQALRLFDSAAIRLLVGWLILVPAWAALLFLHQLSPALVMLVLALIWGADIGAFFVGRQFGRRKLASNVSPGKSWEGVIGGLLAVLVMALIASQLPVFEPLIAKRPALWFIVLCVAVGMVSVLGDLVESLFKRRAGVKDSGTLIPGHGGVLDRIDSLTAAGPCFASIWMLVYGLSGSVG